jgi:origin recognition complex subunit 1
MVEICESRLEGLNVFEPKVLEFCARRVALVSGDARRCLDICRYLYLTRRAVELFQDAKTKENTDLIPMLYIEDALKEMNTSKAVISVKNSSLHQQIFLLSVLNMIKKTGLMDVDFDSVQTEHRDICTMARVKTPSTSVLYSVCQSLGEFKLLVVEMGKLGMPQQKLKINVDRNDIVKGIENAKHPKLISTIKRFKD